MTKWSHQEICRFSRNTGAYLGDIGAQDFLSDLFAGAHGFDDLDPGTIEFGIIFGAYEHAANHS